ncbi:MAG: [LysW]-lysine hydrolase [Leptolyngbya sp. PLA3]|nr:MAG: [LysW]-lysine hydrolase [Cyanobacteria bacterium CYA]MCE7969711.1 [LysW]-lysine hydrolase [Leptolyngbya sp. PL-A3]
MPHIQGAGEQEHVICLASDDLATQVLRDLVATPSVSGNEYAAVERFLAAARSLGLTTSVDEAGNGIATRRTSNQPRRTIALLGHIDTVPGHIPVRIEGGILHGRGSVDAKGPLVTLLFAAARAKLPPDVELVVIAAIGEETPHSPGATFIRDHLRPHACIIGEPSGWDGLALGYKGRLIVHAAATRHCAHTAGPEASASDALLAWWSDVRARVARRNEGVEKVFDQLQAGVRRISSDSDGLADTARLTAGFRLPPAIPPNELEELLASLATTHDITLEFQGREQACATDRRDAVVRAITASIRAAGATPKPKLKTGTADLNIVAPAWRCPIAAYGPGDSTLDHTPVEHLPLTDLHRAIAVLAAGLRTLAEELLEM